MYRFVIRQADKNSEKIKGFTHVTNPRALEFIEHYSDYYRYFFRKVWNMEKTSSAVKSPVCSDDTAECVMNEMNTLQEGGEELRDKSNKIDINAVKSYYTLYSSAAVPMTRKAITYIQQHKGELLVDFDCPPETGEQIYDAIVSYPAINAKSMQIAVHNGDNIKLVNYTDLDVSTKTKKSPLSSSVLGSTILSMDFAQLFLKSGLDKRLIDRIPKNIFKTQSAPNKLRIYGYPESFPRIFSKLISVKNKCSKMDSACFIWFDISSEILGNTRYVYLGAVEDYVKFVLGKCCALKSPFLHGEEDGRCAPYLTNPGIIGEELPMVATNMAGIDIGLHSLFTVATYITSGCGGMIKDQHFGSGIDRDVANSDAAKETLIAGISQKTINGQVNAVVNYLKQQEVKCVAIENCMFAKVLKCNSIKIPKVRPGERISTRKRTSFSEEEVFYINLTGALVAALYTAGIKVYAVETFNTSKVCSNCGELTKPKFPAARTFKCPLCEFEKDRDENAARNILNKLYSAEIRHKRIRIIKLGKKYNDANVYCVGDCYEEEMIEKAAV